MNRLILAAAATAVLVSGCTAQDDPSTPAQPAPTTSAAAGEAAPPSGAAASLLAEHGLDGLDAVGVIDRLDRLGGPDRPADLMASVRPGELQLSSGGSKASLPIPADRFYLSVAPYVEQTHDCFYHSLTTCKGELSAEDVHVRIVDSTSGKVLVDGARTTFANGFVGFWLPRDITGTLEVHYDGKVAATEFSTDEDAPTCLTSVHLT